MDKLCNSLNFKKTKTHTKLLMQTYLNTKSVSLLIWTGSIQLPDEALLFEDKHCQSHIDHLSKFHDDIIFALLEAGDKALPIARPVVTKVMPGWNNYVSHKYFQSSLLWHNIWKHINYLSLHIYVQARDLPVCSFSIIVQRSICE